MSDDRKALLLITVTLTILLIGVFIAAQTEKVNATTYCPPGHTTSWDTNNDPTFNGYYYVYTPNLPAGYSRVVTVSPNETIELPPPATYGPAERIIVCYTHDIYKYAKEIPSTTTTTAPETTTSSSTTTIATTTNSSTSTTDPTATTSTVLPTTNTTIPEIQTDIQENTSMSINWLATIVAFFIGGLFGFLVAALLAAAGADDGDTR